VYEGFSLTVTDAARLLGKSPVTLRKWERLGYFEFPRLGDDRRLRTADMRRLVENALSRHVITSDRARQVELVLLTLEQIESENCRSRPARRGEE
jgi:predicted site-specific integrase-resolvase